MHSSLTQVMHAAAAAIPLETGVIPLARGEPSLQKGPAPPGRGETPLARAKTAVTRGAPPVARETAPPARGAAPPARGRTPPGSLTIDVPSQARKAASPGSAFLYSGGWLVPGRYNARRAAICAGEEERELLVRIMGGEEHRVRSLPAQFLEALPGAAGLGVKVRSATALLASRRGVA
jgi:hypothetical protein